ncbi:MAG: DUF945 family protein, partial [Verrucomicrobiota bacterium]
RIHPMDVAIDYKQGARLKAKGSLGKIKMASAEGGFELGQGAMQASYNQASGSLPILVGNFECTIPDLAITGVGGKAMYEAEDIRILSEAQTESGTYGSFVRYEIGSLSLGALPPMVPPQILQLLDEKTKVEIGSRGLNTKNFAEMEEASRRLQALQMAQIRKQSSGGGGDPASEADLEALQEVWESMLNLIEPGSQFFVDTKIGGGGLALLFDVGLEGDKKLPELETVRELVGALGGQLKVFLRHGVLPQELAEGMLGAQMNTGMVVRMDDGYHLEAKLEKGALLLNGQPSPLLQMPLPFLDQPIPWEMIYGQGVGATAGQPAP